MVDTILGSAFITMLIMITILPMLTKVKLSVLWNRGVKYYFQIDSNIQTGQKIIQIISMPISTRFVSNVLHLIQYHDTEYHTHLKKYYTWNLYFKSVSISNGNDNKVTSPNKKQECGKILTATITRNGLNSLYIYFQFKTGSLFVDSRYVI